MERMNRAGRMEQFTRILRQQSKRYDDPWMTTGMVTRRAGLKSSSHFKNMLFDMAMEIDNVMWREDRGVREYAWINHTQMPLPERFITINGRQHKLANWTLLSEGVSENA